MVIGTFTYRMAQRLLMASNSTILAFPRSTISPRRRLLRREVLHALRMSDAPVILDLSGCRKLDHDDITLLLDCISQAMGRDTQLLLVSGSRDIHVVLDVVRISSLVPVVTSLKEALEFKSQCRTAPNVCDASDFSRVGVVR